MGQALSVLASTLKPEEGMLVPPTRIERAARGLGNLSDQETDVNTNTQSNKDSADLEENSG